MILYLHLPSLFPFKQILSMIWLFFSASDSNFVPSQFAELPEEYIWVVCILNISKSLTGIEIIQNKK